MTSQGLEEIKQSYFKIKTSVVGDLKDLLQEVKALKLSELSEKIKKLETEMESLKNAKKYGLVWDNEKEPEQVVLDCQTKLPILKEIKEREIINDDSGDSNILIEGDNYHALQVLNYTHKEAIDVIYIDPPYNTGNKDFIYNDKFVDREDTYRHSKWLNFMEKRLRLAYDLLKEDGVIFISIDENEFAQLKLLCDEIFSEENFVENFIWKKNSTKNLSKTTSTNHEYVLTYSKNKKEIEKLELFRIKKEGLDEVKNLLLKSQKLNLSKEETQKILRDFYKQNPNLKGISMYNNIELDVDKDKYLAYRLSDISAPKATGVASTYKLIHPKTGLPCKIPTRGWAFKELTMKEHLKNNLIYFYDDETKVPQFKRFLYKVESEVIKSIFEDFTDGKKELNGIFGSAPFENAKPTTLIKNVVLTITNKDSIILDFMAGSGTTGHAVLDLNKEDGGNRKFILCTNNENNICEEVTYERIKRVSNGYTNSKGKEIEGLGGNLRYYKTDFVEIESLKEITDRKRLELTYNAGELLAVKEGIYNELEKNKFWQIFENRTDIVAVYFSETNRGVGKIKKRLEEIQVKKGGKVILYVYDNGFNRKDFEGLKWLELKDIPEPILKVYREVNKGV